MLIGPKFIHFTIRLNRRNFYLSNQRFKPELFGVWKTKFSTFPKNMPARPKHTKTWCNNVQKDVSVLGTPINKILQIVMLKTLFYIYCTPVI